MTDLGVRVSFHGVVKHYGTTRALDGVDLTIEPGEFVALLGPSGCGKTTALRALAGLESVSSGRISIGDEDVQSVPVDRRDLGMVFQSYSLFPHLTARQNVEYGLRMRSVRAPERAVRAAAALELVGLESHGGRYPHELSGGQQQRVALARALVTRPRVLLLDEPLSALDAKVRVSLRDEIRRIQLDLGITTLFVTHDQEEALAVADRVAVMNAGRIEQIGSPEELYLRPRSPFVATFVGRSTRLPAVADSGEVTVLGTRIPLLDLDAPDGPVTVFVRPEDVDIAAEGSPGIPARVVLSSFLGSVRRSTVELQDGTRIDVQHRASEPFEPDERVRIRVTATALAHGPATGTPLHA